MSLAKTVTNTTAPTTRASRRSMLGGAALSFAAAASAVGITAGFAASVAGFVPAEPDAELISLCAKFDVLERHRQHVANAAATMEEDDIADRVWDDVLRQQRPMLDRMCSLPCVTLAGLGALTASLMLWDCGELSIVEDDVEAPTNERLMAALLRSVMAGRA